MQNSMDVGGRTNVSPQTAQAAADYLASLASQQRHGYIFASGEKYSIPDFCRHLTNGTETGMSIVRAHISGHTVICARV